MPPAPTSRLPPPTPPASCACIPRCAGCSLADLRGLHASRSTSVTGHGPLGGGNALFDHLAIPGIGEMLAVNPGVEGIGVDRGGAPALLLPHELVAAKLLSAKRPSDAVPDLAIGVDLARIAQLLSARVGRVASVAPDALYRVPRTDSFVEAFTADLTAAPVALVPRVAAGAEAIGPGAARGGAARRPLPRRAPDAERPLCLRGRSGRPACGPTPRRTGSNYSMPRHAGTTYFLSELYRITKEPWLREPIERAFTHLAVLLAQGQCAGTLPDGTPFDCVLDRGEIVAHLGSTALAVVALVEYQRATGDTRYLPLATKLAAWLLYMRSARTARSATSTTSRPARPTRRPSCSTTPARPRSRSPGCT